MINAPMMSDNDPLTMMLLQTQHCHTTPNHFWGDSQIGLVSKNENPTVSCHNVMHHIRHIERLSLLSIIFS